jgi:hypothetical protein
MIAEHEKKRWGGATAVLSLIIWFILTPFMATIWVYNGGFLIWERKPLLVRTIGHWLAERGAFSFADEEVVYFSYGRYFFLVYLLLIPTLMALNGRYNNGNKRHQRWYKILLGALTVAGISDFVSYGLGIFSEILWRVGFGVEILALLVIIVATVGYGRSLLQQPLTPHWLGWLLIIAAILVPAMFFEQVLAGYWPNSPILPLVLAWAIVGVHLLFHQQLPDPNGNPPS